MLETCILLRPDLHTWFGPNSWLPAAPPSDFVFDIFKLWSPTDPHIDVVFWVLVVAALALTAGLRTQIAAAVVFVCLASFHCLNPFIWNGADALLRNCSFLLIFSPCGKQYSLDEWLQRKFGAPSATEMHSAWAMRLIQLQIVCIYWQAFWVKMGGTNWRDGTAVYYVTHLVEIQRLHPPFIFEQLWVSKLLSWSTLAFEAAFWALIWFKRFRYGLLAFGCLFHLGIELTLNLPVFEVAMISSYLLFLEPADVQSAMDWLKHRLITNRMSAPATS